MLSLDRPGTAPRAARSAYLVGHTTSSDFPTEKPLQDTNKGSYDAFVTKLSGPTAPPSVSIGDATISEGKKGQTTSATFTVSLSKTSPMRVSVEFAAADGSATAPDDYTVTSGTLTFG